MAEKQESSSEARNALAVAGVAVGAVLGLWLLIPVLAATLSQLITAVGAAVAMVVAAASSGIVAGVTVAPWALYTVGAAVGAWGATRTYSIVVNVTQNARKEPFVWSLPLLAIVAGFMIDLAKDFYAGERVIKAIFSVFTGVFILVGGYLSSLPAFSWKLAGAVLQFAPPAIVLAVVATSGAGTDLVSELREVSPRTWLAVGSAVSIAILSTGLAARHAREHAG